MWAQNNLWACMGIFVSGLKNLRPENLYLNNLKSQKSKPIQPFFTSAKSKPKRSS